MKEQIMQDLKDAMRAKDEVRLRTIRSLRAALLDREIELRDGGRGELTPQQASQVLLKQAKQRRDSMRQFRDAGRNDLAEKEAAELKIIEEYLPKQMSDEEVRHAVQKVIDDTGASGMDDIGKVMGPAMSGLKGRADGKRVQEIARELLSG